MAYSIENPDSDWLRVTLSLSAVGFNSSSFGGGEWSFGGGQYFVK